MKIIVTVNAIGDLVVRGIDYTWISVEHLLYIYFVVKQNFGLVSYEEIADYYWRFIQESRKIYDETNIHSVSALISYELWMKGKAIPWFFSFIRGYILDVIAVKGATFEIWGNCKDNWNSYLQWPPEEVMRDVMDLFPSFESMIQNRCPPPPRKTIFI